MSKIKLLHSYLYIENTKNLKIINNKIYDANNNFVCGLINIPKIIKNNDLKILIEKNLVKNKQSKKINNTYYKKNNIKIFIEFETKNNNIINYKNFFLKLLKKNYLIFVDINKRLFDNLCFNKNYKRDLFSKFELVLYNQYVIKIFNLYIDLENNTFTKTIKNKNSKYTINFNIIYSDYILGTINIINEYKLNNLLIVCNNYSMKDLWSKNMKTKNQNIYTINELKFINIFNYKNIITCDLNLKEIKSIKNIENANIVCIYSTFEKETIKDFLKKFYELINLKQKVKVHYDITLQTLYNYCKCASHHCFYDRLLQSKKIKKTKLNNYDNYNPILNFIDFTLKENINENILNKLETCSICLENIKEDDFLYLDCGHKFCKNCIIKLKQYNHSCSICRSKIDKFYKDVNYQDLLNKNKWYYLGENIIKFIDLVNKSKNGIYIYLENMDILNLLTNLLNYKLKKKYIFIFNPKIAPYILKNENNIDIYYLKTCTKMKFNSNTITMFLKNYYKIINLYEINI